MTREKTGLETTAGNPGGGRGKAAFAVLALALATESAAQLRLVPDEEREYVERGVVDPGERRMVRPENRLQARNGVAAYVTKDSLYVQSLHRACLLSVCGGCYPSAWKTHALPLPGGSEAQPPALGLLEAALDDAWNVAATLVIGRSDGTLRRVRIRSGRGAPEVRADSHALPGAGGGRIRAIGGLEHLGGSQDFLVLGTGGLAFRVRDDAAGGLAHEPLPRLAGLDYLAYGRGWAGTDKGLILKIADDAGRLVAIPANTPRDDAIARIDDVAAVTAGGGILWREGRAWYGLGAGVPERAEGVVRTFTRDGISFLPYRDGVAGRPVTMDRRGTARVADRGGLPSPDGSPDHLSYDGTGPRVVTVLLEDPDRNLAPPRLGWIWSDMAEPIGREFVAADPAIGCAATGVCLPGASATLTVRLYPDSFTVSVPVLEGIWSEEPVCKRPRWSGDSVAYTGAVKWARGTAFHLRFGDTEVIIAHGRTVPVRRAPRAAARGPERARPGSVFVARSPSGVPVDAAGREVPRRPLRGP